MRDTTCSVPDVQSRGISCAALSDSAANSSRSNTLPANSTLCADPNCGCAQCMEKCDRIAASGLIPTNFAWWMSQTYFPVELASADRRVR